MKRLAILLIIAWSSVALAGDDVLQAWTSHPESNVFMRGDPVHLTLRLRGGKAPHETELRIEDADGVLVHQRSISLPPDSDVSVELPSQRLGFFRARIASSDGVTTAAMGSLPAGSIPYAVVPDPHERRDAGEQRSFFGLQGGFSPLNEDGQSRAVNMLPWLGVRWVTGGLGWDEEEPDHVGQLTTEGYARSRSSPTTPHNDQHWRMSGSGPQVWRVASIPCLFKAPKRWATPPIVLDTAPTTTGTLTSQGTVQWTDYARRAVTAYAHAHEDRQQRYYELTWEPVYPWGFRGTADDLVSIYRSASAAIHKADPLAVVLGPTGSGLTSEDFGWLENLLAHGLASSIDGFSVHPYVSFPPEDNGLIEAGMKLRAMLGRYGKADAPLIGTEQGFRRDAAPEAEREQALGVVRSNLIQLGEGWRLNLAFYAADYTAEKGYGLFYNLRPGQPYATDHVAPKPAVPAYAAMTFLLDGARPVRRLHGIAPGVYGYAYRRGGVVTLALWTAHDETVVLPVCVGTNEASICDWMGNAIGKPDAAGNAVLHLSARPVYVQGASLDLWGEPLLTMPDPRASELIASSGEETPIMVATAPGFNVQPASASVTASPSHQLLLRLPPDASGIVNVPIRSVSTTNPARSSWDTIAVATQPAVSIKRVLPLFEEWPALQVQLENKTKRPLALTLRARINGIPESRREVSLTLNPEHAKPAIISFDGAACDPFLLTDAIVEVVSGQTVIATQATTLNFLNVNRISGPVKIDGTLAKWTATPAHRLAQRHLLEPQAPVGARFAVNATHLFMVIEVPLIETTSAPTMTATLSGTAAQETSGNEVRDRAASVNFTLSADGKASSGAVSAMARRAGSSFCFEASVPLKSLGDLSSKVIALDLKLTVPDADGPKSTSVFFTSTASRHADSTRGFLCLP